MMLLPTHDKLALRSNVDVRLLALELHRVLVLRRLILFSFTYEYECSIYTHILFLFWSKISPIVYYSGDLIKTTTRTSYVFYFSNEFNHFCPHLHKRAKTKTNLKKNKNKPMEKQNMWKTKHLDDSFDRVLND